MGIRDFCSLVFIMGFLSSGSLPVEPHSSRQRIAAASTSSNPKRMLLSRFELKPTDNMPQMDVTTPLPTVPVINPSSNPTATTTYSNPIPSVNPSTPMMTPANPYTTPANPYTTPAMGIPSSSSSGRSWCIASQTASQTALQVALDYACGYGGADCSEIQAGASCNNPDTVRDHASYAFNSYYQKNPIPTSCDFGGTAVITNVDPSTSTCQYPSTSTSSSVLNTTTPTGPSIYGSVPPDSTNSASALRAVPSYIALMCLLISMGQRIFIGEI